MSNHPPAAAPAPSDAAEATPSRGRSRPFLAALALLALPALGACDISEIAGLGGPNVIYTDTEVIIPHPGTVRGGSDQGFERPDPDELRPR